PAPAEEWRVPHLDGHEQYLIKGEEDRNLDNDGQAARQGRNLLLLVKLHQLLLLLHAVVGIKLLETFHFRLQLLHLAHRFIRFIGKREEQALDQHRHYEDGKAEISDELVEKLKQPEQRLGQIIEPAP